MDDPKSLWALLSRAAQLFPTKGCIVHDDSNGPLTRITYSQLYHKAVENGLRLQQQRVIPEEKIVVLYFESHEENVIWCWSVIAAGGIPAILSNLSPETTTLKGQLNNINGIFNYPSVVTSSPLSRRFKVMPGLKVYTTRDLMLEKVPQHVLTYHSNTQTDPEALSLVLFTSGSTGHAKAVRFTCLQLMASIRAKIGFHGHTENTKFLNWISFDHSANFCEMHLVSMYVGSNQFHAATSDIVAQPANFFNIIGTQGIGYAFAPSFFLAGAAKAFAAQTSSPFLDFSKLAYIMTGGEAIKTTTIEAVDKILVRYGAHPDSIRIAYGLSETCSATFYNTHAPSYDVQRGNVFVSAGRHLTEGVQLRVVDEAGVKVASGTPGSVELRGDIVFKGYHNNKVATKECMTPDGWFRTGDLGTVDEEGNLNIVGRSKEIIIINGNNYSSFELEHCIETDNTQGLTPTYTATFGVWDERNETEGVVVMYNPAQSAEHGDALNATIRGVEKAVIKFCLKAPVDILPLPKSHLPKSTLGKLSRAKLKQQYTSGLLEGFRKTFRELSAIGFDGPISTNGHANGNMDSAMNANGADYSINASKGMNGMGKVYDYDPTKPTNLTKMQNSIANILAEETRFPLSKLTPDFPMSHLGIDSLGYMRIKKALEKAFEMEDTISMSLLLQAGSIRDVEEGLLAVGTVPPGYDPVVPLVSHGSKIPLWFMHPGSGEVLCWLTILKHLPDRPLYAIKPRGLHKSDGYFKDLDDMITSYVAAIRRQQPHGPYAMLGFCLGGSVAFEIAKRLEADDEEISFLAGIDNPPDLRNLRVLEDFRKILSDVLPQLGVISEAQMKEFNAEHDENTHFEDLYRALVKKFGESILIPFDLTLPGLIQRARVDWSMRQIFAPYIPNGSVSKFDVFWVPPMEALNSTEDEWRSKYLGEWNDFSKTEVNFYKCIGNHLNVMQGEENIQCFQKALNEAMRARNI